MGCYLAPDNTLMIKRVVEALKERPKGSDLLVADNMNVNLTEPEGDRREENIAATLATDGLEDMAAHFLPRRRRWCQDKRTWSMFRLGREVQSRTDYIMGIDNRLFRNMTIQEPWHKSDHNLVPGCLCSTPLREHTKYLGRRTQLPL